MLFYLRIVQYNDAVSLYRECTIAIVIYQGISASESGFAGIKLC